MAVVGNPTGKNDSILRGYEQDSMHGIASQFAQIAKAGLSEQVDLYSEPRKFFMSDTLNNEMRSFFVENAFDKQDPKFSSIDAVNEEYGMLNALYQNDVKGICEAAPLGAYNPVVGITFPMHKNLLMTTLK